MKTIPFEATNDEHLDWLVEIWNDACGADLAINRRLAAFNTAPATGVRQAGLLAIERARPVGFVLCSAVSLFKKPPYGTIDAIAVVPGEQRNGTGKSLLGWAEGWLNAQGCAHIQVGANPRIFAPGVPVETGSTGFFLKHGYSKNPEWPYVWDMARSLKNYQSDYLLKPVYASLLPAQPGEQSLLAEMIRTDFSGFWLYEFEEMLREGGRLDEYLVLRVEDKPVGFCQVAFENSVRPIERFYMHRLPHPWAQMGTFGILESQRGKGYGAILIDGAARYLRDQGIDGCVIDWTGYLDLYSKFGFKPYRQYVNLEKTLE